MFGFRPAVCVCSICLVAPVWGAIEIDGYSTFTNDRFANSSSFVMDDFDLSGVGITSSGGARWVTMVSPNVFVSAQHFAPTTGQTVEFFETNNRNGASTTRTIVKSERIGSSDLRIGTLDSPLEESYATYSFATEEISSSVEFSSSSYAGQNAYLFGRSERGFPASVDMAVGRNRLDVWITSVTAAGTTDSAIGSVVDSDGQPNFVTNEAFLQSGDSGAPMFVEDGIGGIKLVGVNWFADDILGSDVNGQTYVGNYATEIANYIAANPVPEPRIFGFVSGLLAVGFAVCRRKRRS